MPTLRAIKSLLVVGSFFMTAMLCNACSARGDPATASNQTKVIPMGTTFFTTHSASSVFSVAWSPDGKHLALGYADGGVQVWDATTGTISFTAWGHHGEV